VSVVITEQCITCGACEWECPNEAISPGAPRPVVNEQRCTECYGFFGESQCIVVCPASAISVRPEAADTLAERFIRLNPHNDANDVWIWHRIGYEAPPTSTSEVV